MKDAPQLAIKRRKCFEGLILLLVAMSTATIGAEEMRWEGTLEPDLAAFPPLRFEGSGVATVKGGIVKIN